MNNIISLSNLNLYKNQKIKIAIFGGSFDPAHEGHIHLAKNALEKCNFNEIWFSLSGSNPIKPPYKYSLKDRIEKLEKIISNKNFKISILESELGSNLTSNFFEFLKNDLPNIEFTFIGGADLLLQFEKWDKFDQLISITDIVIFSRAGYSKQAKQELYLKKDFFKDKVRFIDMDELDISSTEIKKQEELDDK